MIVYKNQRFEKKNTPERFYICKDKFNALWREYKKTGIVSNELGEMFFLLSKKIASARNFRGYTFIEDCIQDGLLTCLKYIHNFDPDKSTNAFGYFSMIIIRSFLVKIRTEECFFQFKKKMFKYDEAGYLVEENNVSSDFSEELAYSE